MKSSKNMIKILMIPALLAGCISVSHASTTHRHNTFEDRVDIQAFDVDGDPYVCYFAKLLQQNTDTVIRTHRDDRVVIHSVSDEDIDVNSTVSFDCEDY